MREKGWAAVDLLLDPFVPRRPRKWDLVECVLGIAAATLADVTNAEGVADPRARVLIQGGADLYRNPKPDIASA